MRYLVLIAEYLALAGGVFLRPFLVSLTTLIALSVAERPISLFLLSLLVLSLPVGASAQTSTAADICIYSGNAGGVMAAVEAAREGCSVIVIEPSRHLGGMTSGGLSNSDQGNRSTIGGLAAEFYHRVAAVYHQKWASQIEPHVAERVFDEMVSEKPIHVCLGRTLAKVTCQGTRLASVITDDGSVYSAKVFIDASYEGDLMAMAGVSFTLKREANSQYGETLNGVQFQSGMMPVFNWGKPGSNGRRPDGRGVWDRDIPIDPYRTPGDPQSGLLPLILPDTPGPVGTAAPGVQAYCYRTTMTDDPDNRIPLTMPSRYDAANYEIVARFIAACQAAGDDVDLRWFVQAYPLPNRKWDFNCACWGSDLDGSGKDWCEGDSRQRAAIAQRHKEFQQGLYWFLLADPRVPQKVKDQLSAFGYCKDEFADNGGWPYQLYVREGRRMISDLVMTEQYVKGKQVAPNSIGLASYGIDVHTVRRLVYHGMVVREGKIGTGCPHPYPIGYAAIVPRRTECTNLLVTFALSSSHIGFASIRMEPVLMNTSQSAASAACLAIEQNLAVQDVPYNQLRSRLISHGQVLEFSSSKGQASDHS